MDKKYLHKVIDQIVRETEIDYNREVLSIPPLHHFIPTFSIYQFPNPPLTPPTEALNTSFLFYNFMKHCRDVYGLNYGEIIYVWKKYRKIIIDKIENNG